MKRYLLLFATCLLAFAVLTSCGKKDEDTSWYKDWNGTSTPEETTTEVPKDTAVTPSESTSNDTQSEVTPSESTTPDTTAPDTLMPTETTAPTTTAAPTTTIAPTTTAADLPEDPFIPDYDYDDDDTQTPVETTTKPVETTVKPAETTVPAETTAPVETTVPAETKDINFDLPLVDLEDFITSGDTEKAPDDIKGALDGVFNGADDPLENEA